MYKIVVIIFSVIIIQCSHGFDLKDIPYRSEALTIAREAIAKFQHEEIYTKNEECSQQLKLFFRNVLNSAEDGPWALKMLDASAKIPPGVLEINFNWLGRFSECLNIESLKTNVKGKYCLNTPSVSNVLKAEISQNKSEQHNQLQSGNIPNNPLLSIGLFLGICIPDKCTEADIQNTFNKLTPTFQWTATCQTKESVNGPLDTGAIVTICYFGIFGFLLTASTIYDMYSKKSKLYPLLTSFSVYTNGKKLFALSKNSGEFLCLHGIKFLSMMWVVIGHTFITTIFGPTSNFLDVLNFADTTKSMFLVNAVHSVDTFFVITGMLVVYSFMKAMHQGQKFNLIIFYLHRYIRLTPALIPVVISSIYLTKYLGYGPFTSYLDMMIAQPCRDSWWSTLLYVQNYVNLSKDNALQLCIAQTWYLNIDWQVYLISPLFLLFLPKLPQVGLGIMLCATVGSMIAGYVITWNDNLISIMTNINGNTADYNRLYYMVTHTRVSTWFIGGFLGYILAKIKLDKNLIYKRIPKWCIGLIWITVLAAIPTCVFAGHSALTSEVYHAYSNAFYNAFTRPAWGLCISWVIFACCVGYGGIINTFLSLPVFQILSRFTYSMYLVHLTLLYIIAYSRQEPAYYTMFNLCYSFWGALALSFGLSIFWVLAFESPIVMIEKYLLGHKTQSGPNKETNGFNSRHGENNMVYKTEQP